jgi:uncharacterized protein YrrD
MLVLSEKLLNMPVMSLQTGGRLATTTGVIIDPRKLHVVAYYCEGPMLETSPAVLHTSDIRELSNIGMIVNEAEDITGLDDLVRLKEIIDFNFELPGIKVIDNHKTKLGKVQNYAVNTANFMVQKLYVQRPLFKSLNDSELVIDRSQIVEVTNDHIVVRAPSVEAREAKPARADFANPFRKTDTQPEV